MLHEPFVACQQVLACLGPHLVREQVALVDEFHVLVHRAGLQHLVKGVDIVRHGAEDLAAHAPQVVSHRLVLAEVAVDRDPLDQRAHGMVHLLQRPAVVHRGEGDVPAVQVFPEHQAHRAHEEAALGNVQFVAEGFHPFRRQRSRFIPEVLAHAGCQRPVQVAVQRGHVVRVLEQVQVVFLCPLVGPVLHQPFFVQGRLLDRIVLTPQGHARQRAVHFGNEQADGGPVKEDQVAFDRQVAALRCTVYRQVQQD